MLLFLIKHSSPDIANCTRELSKVLDGATESAYKEMLRVIKFVIDTKNWGLHFKPKFEEKNKWTLTMYTDSDYAGDKETRISVTFYGSSDHLEIEIAKECDTVVVRSRVCGVIGSSKGHQIRLSTIEQHRNKDRIANCGKSGQRWSHLHERECIDQCVRKSLYRLRQVSLRFHKIVTPNLITLTINQIDQQSLPFLILFFFVARYRWSSSSL